MKVLKEKKCKVLMGFVLAVCMLCSLKTAAMESMNDMDTTDHRIVAKICPDIQLSEPEKDVTLQLILQEAWKSALKKYGQYIKF
jgi:hypothetical protein